MSSILLFNTTSIVGEKGIEELKIISEMTKFIQTKVIYLITLNKTLIDKEELLKELSPYFLWVLRDTSSDQLRTEDGLKFSNKEIFEIGLNNKPVTTYK